jgi:cobalt-zinc-cadmium resistance protein CzcA
MTLRGESANLLSVGAIDFGLIVDGTVIMVENIFRHLSEGEQHQEFAPTGIAQRFGLTGKLRTILRSAGEVNQAIFFAAAIIIAGFVPLFTLSGVEGHIFSPMAKTYAYAIAGGLLATFTISPAFSALLLPERVSETETIIVRGLRRVYQPLLEFAGANRILTLAGAGLLHCWQWPGYARSASNSCPISRKEICGVAPPCRPRSLSKRRPPTSTACAR